MEVKVSIRRVLDFLTRRDSDEGNIGGGVKRKVMFQGK